MAFGVGEGIAALGAFGGLLQGQGAATKQKQILGLQRQYAKQQLGQYQQTLPLYNQLIQQYAQDAGLGGYGDTRDPYGTNQLDRLRLQQAEQQIAGRQQQQEQALRFKLGQAGIASGSIAAALARNAQQGQDQYAQFRRSQLLAAPEQQRQRQLLLQQALAFGLGSGGSGAQILGDQASVYGAQANQGFQGIQNLIQQYQYAKMLEDLRRVGAAHTSGQPAQGLLGADYRGNYSSQF